MKVKTMNAVISKKMNDWLSSIDDPKLVRALKKDIIVTGGCITSMLLNEDINDFDVYFRTKSTTKAVAQYYAEKFNNKNDKRTNGVGQKLHAWVLDGEDLQKWKNGEISLSEFAYDYNIDATYDKVLEWEYDESEEENNKYFKLSGMLLNTTEDRIKVMVNSDGIAEDSDSVADSVDYSIDGYLDALSDGDEVLAEELEQNEKYKPVFISTNAITLSNKVQLIMRFYGEPEEIHSNYDFVHVTNYWTYSTGVVVNQEALLAIMNKELKYVGSKYPIASLVRTRKFIKRGWQINAGQYVKIAFQISELDLTNIYVLEDQLVGVDSIYFLNFIENLKKAKSKDKDFSIDKTYVGTVIDKIFG